MGDDPTITPEASRRKGGRPSRLEASAKALHGVDPAAVDPVKILREIAADSSQPGSTRVAACRALLGLQEQPAEPDGRVNERAIALMRRAN
jgi:hypothetical protein